MHAVADTPNACENCATALQGSYCHVCGQHGVNPLRHFAHAFEEVFESFWHLDGRAFRTLRDLLVPGRVARNYLAGQRVRYIPPLRVFLVLTVVTFFIGQLTVDDSPASTSGKSAVEVDLGGRHDGGSDFASARTEAEVQAVLDKGLAGVRDAREATKQIPMVQAGFDRTEAALRSSAAKRLAQIHAAANAPVARAVATTAVPDQQNAPALSPAGVAKPGSTPADAKTAANADSGDKSHKESVQEAIDEGIRGLGIRLRDAKSPWNERDNPADFARLPTFADAWVNHRLGNFERNVERMDADKSKSAIAHLVLAAVPSALFLLVPVFALLLKLFYLGSRRGYLEHLVVALYSHAFLVLTLMATFVLALVTFSPAMGAATGPIRILLWVVGVPVYLLLMQRHVYGEHWGITVVKYLCIGVVYQFLVGFAAIYMMLAGLTSG